MTLHPYKHSICVIQSSSFVYDSTVRQYGINILRRFRILKTCQTSLIFSTKLWRDLLSDLRQGFAEGIINLWQTSYHKVWQSRRGWISNDPETERYIVRPQLYANKTVYQRPEVKSNFARYVYGSCKSRLETKNQDIIPDAEVHTVPNIPSVYNCEAITMNNLRSTDMITARSRGSQLKWYRDTLRHPWVASTANDQGPFSLTLLRAFKPKSAL